MTVVLPQMSDIRPLRDQRPVALQVSDDLRERIASSMAPGDQIPTEHELAAQYAVSRATVREALKLLEQDGILDVRHGRGRFVSAASGLLVNRPVTTFESLTEMLKALGYEPQSRVVSAEIGEATEEEGTALDLAAGSPVVRLVRLYEQKGRALIVSINAFDVALLGGADVADVDFSGSLDHWLKEHGRQPQSSAAQIRAEMLPADTAALTGADPGAPWLSITERCVDATGASVLFARDFHRGDIFTFHVLRRRAG
jgi:GntR family transcriptional regulator